jgi:hypothetical protein
MLQKKGVQSLLRKPEQDVPLGRLGEDNVKVGV